MQPSLRRARTRERDQRGAVTLMMTVMLAVLMVSCAFVVDLGMKRVARSDVQALADVVRPDQLNAAFIVPSVFDPAVTPPSQCKRV